MQGRGRLLIVVVAGLCSGCTIGQKMFQMDSNSRMPFLGIDLLARQDRHSPKTTEVTPVNGSANEPTTVISKPVAMEPAKEPSLLERLKLKRSPDRIPLQMTAADGALDTGPRDEFR